ncbi:MAG: hypothetical protein JXB30_11620 [Anaerolineae bacterium]|nr:hypothetical protein [Anaerolineae bacterium]
MKRDRFILLLSVLTLAIFAVLALVYRDFVREDIVIPVFYLLWIVVRIIRSVPQAGCLAGAVIAGIVIALLGLYRLWEPEPRPTRRPAPTTSPSRYRFWLRRCRQMDSSAFFLDDMSSEMRRLLLSVLAYQEHRDTSEMERLIVRGAFDVPPAVRDLVTSRRLGDLAKLNKQKGVLARLWERLWRGSASSQLPAENAAEQQLEQVVAYLEERLEAHGG